MSLEAFLDRLEGVFGITPKVVDDYIDGQLWAQEMEEKYPQYLDSVHKGEPKLSDSERKIYVDFLIGQQNENAINYLRSLKRFPEEFLKDYFTTRYK
jgi:hypothetical protein